MLNRASANMIFILSDKLPWFSTGERKKPSWLEASFNVQFSLCAGFVLGKVSFLHGVWYGAVLDVC